MKKISMFIILVLAIAIVGAAFYPEPWGNDQDAGNN